MNIVDMFARINTGEVKMQSELGSRDESKQSKSFGTRIQKLKLATGINARALAMKDLVIPFNPTTCEQDDTYNKKTPFRPILLVSQTIEGIKSLCRDNADLAAKWETMLGGKFDDCPEATMNDYRLFRNKKMVFPRVVSYATVALNFGGVCGFSEYRTKYTVDPTQLNDGNSYDYDNAPIWEQGARFFAAILRPEAEDLRAKLEQNNVPKDTVATQVRGVYGKSPIGFVSPTNLFPFLYFPLNVEPAEVDVQQPQSLEQHIRFMTYTDKWTSAMSELNKNPMFDTDMDFYDFTINTPTSKDTKPGGGVYTDQDFMALYTAMSIRNTDARLGLHGGKSLIDGKEVDNDELFANIVATAKAYFLYSQEQSGIEGGDTFEKIMASSNRFRTIESAMPKFLQACHEVFTAQFAESTYFTDEIKRANSEFFTAMNPANALALAAEDEDDLIEAANRQKAIVGDIIKDAREDGGDITAMDLEMGELDLGDAEG